MKGVIEGRRREEVGGREQGAGEESRAAYQILRFEVSEYNVFAVQILQSRYNIRCEKLCLLLAQCVFLIQILK